MSRLFLKSLALSCCLVAVLLLPVFAFSEIINTGCTQLQNNPYTVYPAPTTESFPAFGLRGSGQGYEGISGVGVKWSPSLMRWATFAPGDDVYSYWTGPYATSNVVGGCDGSCAGAGKASIYYFVGDANTCKWQCNSMSFDCSTCVGTSTGLVTTGVSCSSASPASTTVCGGKDILGLLSNFNAYCSASSVYQDADSFMDALSGYSDFTYETVVGSDGVAYKCAIMAKNANGTITLFPSNISEPSTDDRCITSSALSAIRNTDAGLAGYGKNSGFYKNYNDTGLHTPVDTNSDGLDDSTGAEIIPADPLPVIPDANNDGLNDITGVPITNDETAPTGIDGNGDGLDDRTGAPLPSSSGVPCTDLNKDGLDDVTGLLCLTTSGGATTGGAEGGTQYVGLTQGQAQTAFENALNNKFGSAEAPAVPEYDTSIENLPEQDLTGLLSSFAGNNPVQNVLSNSGLSLSGAVCSVSGSVFGHVVSLDFCRPEIISNLDMLGIMIVSLSALSALILIFS